MIAEALHALIVADAGVIAAIAEYEFTTGSPTPAVFTTDRFPNDVEYPAIRINEFGGDDDFGTRGKKGGEPLARIRIFEQKERDTSVIRKIAWDVWRLVSRAELVDPDGIYDIFRVQVEPPQQIPDEDDFPGWLLTVSSLFIEK